MSDNPETSLIRIPGYEGGPFRHQPELLGDHLFWVIHLRNCCRTADVEERDTWEAGELYSRKLAGGSRPVFTVPLAGGHRLYVIYRTFEEDKGTDYLLHHPDWAAFDHLAAIEGHFMGPGLSWAELTAAADNGLPGGSTTDAHARLLLLLPAFSDDSVPDDAVERLTAALRARTRVEVPERMAEALLEDQAPWGPVHWTIAEGGYLVNNGRYSNRNPANRWPAARRARAAQALAPGDGR